MASGSGRGQRGIRIQEPVPGQREDSAAAANPPSSATLSELLQERVHGSPGPGGGSPSAATDRDRKGKAVMPPSPGSSPTSSSSSTPTPTSSAGSSPGTPLPVASVSGTGGSASAPVDGAKPSKVSWKDPVVDEVELVPRVTRQVDVKSVFDAMVMAQRWAEEEETAKQQVKPPTIWKSPRSKVKGSLAMCLRRVERHSRGNPEVMQPHVHHQTIPMTGIIKHYNLLEMVAGRGIIVNSNVLDIRRAYSDFRPVHGDGECFYRSFIFSYLEQVLDRQDTNEEHRLLAAVKGLARQQVDLGWTSEFSRSHKAFKKLIKKVMRWKRHSRWIHVPTSDSYRKQKLLEFFSGYGTTNDIFAFLRLVAAIWICLHSEEFEPLIPELSEDLNLRDWCFREVIQRKVFTDHVQITALATALGVPLRVEYLVQGRGIDLYTGQDSEDDTPTRTCWPHRRHLLPPGHQVPRVIVLYANIHYDILYPHRRDGAMLPIAENPSQRTAQVERPLTEYPSPRIDRASSSSGEISQVESSAGKSSDEPTVQGGS